MSQVSNLYDEYIQYTVKNDKKHTESDLKFDTDNYEFVFEQVLDEKTCRELFKKYLKEHFPKSMDSLNFFEKVEKYKVLKSKENKIRLLMGLIKEFVEPSKVPIDEETRQDLLDKKSEFQIVLDSMQTQRRQRGLSTENDDDVHSSSSNRDSLKNDNVTNVNTLDNTSNADFDSKDSLSPKTKNDSPHDEDLTTKLSQPISRIIFDDALRQVIDELKKNIFPKFVRSSAFKGYVTSHNVSKLGVFRPLPQKDQLPVYISKIDFSKTFIQDCDVEFLRFLSTDSNLWKINHENPSFTSFVSRYRCVMKSAPRNKKGSNLYKAVGVLDYPIEYVLYAMLTPIYRTYYENNLSNSVQIDYVKTSTDLPEPERIEIEDGDPFYPTTIVSESYPLAWPLTNRDFSLCYSCIPEESTGGYMVVNRSCVHPGVPVHRGTIRAKSVGGWVLEKISDNKTRYINAQYLDMGANSGTASEKILNRLSKSRAKNLHTGLNKVMEKAKSKSFPKPKFSNGILNTLDDYIRIHRQLEQDSDKSTMSEDNQLNIYDKNAKTDDPSKQQQGLLKRLTYLSKFSRPMSDAELQDIATVSVRNNMKINVTGVLMCANGNFYQVIEGDPQKIDELYKKISADNRHVQVQCLKQEYNIREEDRQFSNWSMKTVNLDSMDHYFAQSLKHLLHTISRMGLESLKEGNESNVVEDLSTQFLKLRFIEKKDKKKTAVSKLGETKIEEDNDLSNLDSTDDTLTL